MTGTVRYIYSKPSLADYEGKVNAGISSTEYGGDSYDFDGVLSIPLVRDKFGVRLVGYKRDDAGWIDRPLIAQEDVNNDDTNGIRAHTLWGVTDAFTLTTSFIHQESASGGRSAWQGESPSDPFELYEECDPKETCTGEITCSGQKDRWSSYNVTANYELGFGNFFLTSSYLDRMFARSLDNTVIIANIRGIRLPDGGFDRFNPRARHMIQQIQDRTLWSSEARFSSDWNGAFQLIGGVFYQEEKNDFSSNVGSTDSNGTFDDAAVRDNSLWRLVNTEIDHSAVFGELSYQATEALTGTIGARYYEFDVLERANGLIGCCSGNVPGTGPGALQESDDDGVNMKYNLSYHVSDNFMLFAQAAEGFRSGGTNEPSIEPLPVCEGFETFSSDSLWNYEIGMKTSWLNNRLIINATPYFIEWSDIQIRVFKPECRSFFIQNAGKAEVKGIEVETAWQPNESLNLSLALGYADAKLTQDAPLQAGPLIDGQAGDGIPYTPDFTSKLGVTYTVPLAKLAAALVMRGDWAYTSSSKTQFRDTAPLQRVMPSYNLFNIRVGLEGDEGWRGTLFVNNVFNDLSDVSRYPSASMGSGDYVFTSRPREIGVSVSKEFF